LIKTKDGKCIECVKPSTYNAKKDRCETKVVNIPACKEGFSYNKKTGKCEKEMIVVKPDMPVICKKGTKYNKEKKRCEKVIIKPKVCNNGYLMNLKTKKCEKEKPTIILPICTEGYILEKGECTKTVIK